MAVPLNSSPPTKVQPGSAGGAGGATGGIVVVVVGGGAVVVVLAGGAVVVVVAVVPPPPPPCRPGGAGGGRHAVSVLRARVPITMRYRVPGLCTSSPRIQARERSPLGWTR